MKANELKVLADLANENKADDFWKEFRPTLFDKMTNMAKSGSYGCCFNGADKEMNPYRWLSAPHLYKKVIKELETLGFGVVHCNDVKDGTYMIISWNM